MADENMSQTLFRRCRSRGTGEAFCRDSANSRRFYNFSDEVPGKTFLLDKRRKRQRNRSDGMLSESGGSGIQPGEKIDP